MSRKFQLIRGLPQIQKVAAVLWLNISAAAAGQLRLQTQVPLANLIGRVDGFAELGGNGGQIFPESEPVVPHAGFGGVAASH